MNCCVKREWQDKCLVDQMNEMLIMRRRGPEVGQAISIELREYPTAFKTRQFTVSNQPNPSHYNKLLLDCNPPNPQKHNTSMLKPPTLFEGIRGWTV